MAINIIISTGSRKIIEFFGLPGAGKTTLAKRLAQEKGLPVITIKSRLERWFMVLVFAISHPFVFRYFSALIRRETAGDKKLLAHKRYLFSCAIAKETKAQIRRNGGVIDDGLFQFALSIYEKEITKMETEKILAKLDNNRVIVIVEAANEERMARMKDRGRVPRFFLGEEYLRNWESILARNYEKLKDVLVERFHTCLVSN